MAGVARCLGKNVSCPSWHSKKSEEYYRPTHRLISFKTRMDSQSLSFGHQSFTDRYLDRHLAWKMFAVPVSVDDEPSPSSSLEDYPRENNADALDNSSESVPTLLDSNQVLNANTLNLQLQALMADSARSKLTKKLSEANQHNRFLKRQLQARENESIQFKSDLAVMELELQALAKLAEEVAQTSTPPDSRKINGKYIQSHLLNRLEAVREKVKEQIKGVDAIQMKDVHLCYFGMAESVQVMGSFDGWSRGESLSQEYDGSVNKLSTTLRLRPGRYEIKFLVDGEWQLSPELPTVGEGMLENNLLVVE
ncbi:hypothetical protein Sjap_024763 [Stephania japonica]|uniref:AMP-activated protein kinase glycogen-binding domain-containing protein n=1 Tax=Stephania japonica TaxID=461633 RepID=A0AAP0EDY5_9MAGN